MPVDLSDEALAKLLTLSRTCEPLPWKAQFEGRDHLSGDSFIMVGTQGGERSEDIYVSQHALADRPDLLDLIAAARNYLPALITEVQRLRKELTARRT